MIDATEIDNSQKTMLKMKNLGIEHLDCTENVKVLSQLLKNSFNKNHTMYFKVLLAYYLIKN